MENKQKTYILDSNILMSAPHALFVFDEHNVFITDVTVDELDRHKNDPGETGANVRQAIRNIESLRSHGNIMDGIRLPLGGGIFKVIAQPVDEKLIPTLPGTLNKDIPDNNILKACLSLSKSGENVILVSNDTIMRLKADMIGIRSEEYRTDIVPSGEKEYLGRSERLVVPGSVMKFYNDGYLDLDDLYEPEKGDAPVIHEFVILKDAADFKQTALGRFDGNKIVPLKYAKETPYDVVPKNAGQIFMQEALLSPAEEIPLVIIKGAAGSAKTFYSLACGLESVVNQNAYRRILLSRPNVKFDADIGYLKGTEEDKIAPLIRPAMDNLELLTQINQKESYVEDLFEMGYIEAQAMAYMRGRSITNTWIILDEVQNSTPIQMFGMISRAGLGSKVILLGDPDQIDNPKLDSRSNGLSYSYSRMKGSPLAMCLTMDPGECVRSALAVEAVKRMSPKGFLNPMPGTSSI